jgi:hypothetical protein
MVFHFSPTVVTARSLALSLMPRASVADDARRPDKSAVGSRWARVRARQPAGAGAVSPQPVWWPQNAAGTLRAPIDVATHGSHPDGPRVPKNFKNRVGSLAAENSPTDAVITADISLTVRAYDHASLGSPRPPKHLGVESGVGMPSPALLLRGSFLSHPRYTLVCGPDYPSESEPAPKLDHETSACE